MFNRKEHKERKEKIPIPSLRSLRSLRLKDYDSGDDSGLRVCRFQSSTLLVAAIVLPEEPDLILA